MSYFRVWKSGKTWRFEEITIGVFTINTGLWSRYSPAMWHLIIAHRHRLSIINDKTTLQVCDTYNRTSLLIIGLSSFQCVFFSIIRIRITGLTVSVYTWQSCIRAQMISTAKALINSNNPNILIQLYKSENYLTRNGQVRCYRHKF